jgi:hypothetical protein
MTASVEQAQRRRSTWRAGRLLQVDTSRPIIGAIGENRRVEGLRLTPGERSLSG